MYNQELIEPMQVRILYTTCLVPLRGLIYCQRHRAPLYSILIFKKGSYRGSDSITSAISKDPDIYVPIAYQNRTRYALSK